MALPKYQQEANEQYFKHVVQLLKNNGFYTWPAANETYQSIDGKLKPLKKSGYQKLSEIVSKKFLTENIIEP